MFKIGSYLLKLILEFMKYYKKVKKFKFDLKMFNKYKNEVNMILNHLDNIEWLYDVIMILVRIFIVFKII
jgi:hypothetical protein